MVATEDNRKLASSGVARDDASYGFTHPGYGSRVLHVADWWVALLDDLFKLVMSVKLNLPSYVLELLLKTGLHQVDRAVVNSEFSLRMVVALVSKGNGCKRGRTWPPLNTAGNLD